MIIPRWVSYSGMPTFWLIQMKPMNSGSRNIEPGISCVPITVSPNTREPRNL